VVEHLRVVTFPHLWCSLLVTLALSLAASLALAMPPDLTLAAAQEEALFAQARTMNEAFAAGRYDLVIDATLPDAVRGMGGRARAVEVVAKGVVQMKAEGVTFLESPLTTVRQCVKVRAQLQCVVDGYQRLRIREGVIRGAIEYVAVSDDGGKRWTFGSNSRSTEQFRQALPWLSKRLQLRGQSRPVLEQQ
jgi:hypothetical protein